MAHNTITNFTLWKVTLYEYRFSKKMNKHEFRDLSFYTWWHILIYSLHLGW